MPKLSRPSHATVVAYLALIVALSGSAYAASKIGSADIQRNAVKGKHIANGVVGSKDAKDDGLTGADVDESTLAQVPSAAALGGIASSDVLSRGLNPSAQSEIGLIGYSYFGNTSGSNTYAFGQLELRTNGVAGQYMVCKPATGGNSQMPIVLYVNGTRSTTSVTNPNTCTSPFDVGAGGDFEMVGRGVHVFGIHSGDSSTNENYYLFGIGGI